MADTFNDVPAEGDGFTYEFLDERKEVSTPRIAIKALHTCYATHYSIRQSSSVGSALWPVLVCGVLLAVAPSQLTLTGRPLWIAQ